MNQRNLERLHLVVTLDIYGPLTAIELVEIANSECQHDAFDSLPEISRRGVGQKLNGLWRSGLVEGEPGDDRKLVWRTTHKGHEYRLDGLNELGPDRKEGEDG